METGNVIRDKESNRQNRTQGETGEETTRFDYGMQRRLWSRSSTNTTTRHISWKKDKSRGGIISPKRESHTVKELRADAIRFKRYRENSRFGKRRQLSRQRRRSTYNSGSSSLSPIVCIDTGRTVMIHFFVEHVV